MTTESNHRPTELLQRLCAGDQAAADQLIPLLYPELHRLAEIEMAKQPANHTLQPTALVNEAYLRLIQQKSAHWPGRKEFLFVASKAMRSVLVDHARRKRADKRGGRSLRVSVAS